MEIMAALIVGLVIGVMFKALKLPVPVPHGVAGLAGLIGMFISSEAYPLVVTFFTKK